MHLHRGDGVNGLDPVRLASDLRHAEVGNGFVPLFTERFPDLTWEDARAVALARDELRRADGEKQIGYKLGWTSSAMREALGIEQPNWGTLWENQRLGTSLDLNDYRHPKVEPELVYIAGADLRGAVTVEDVANAAAGWTIGLEIVDPRFVDFDFAWLDNTADNSSAAGVVIGPVVEPPSVGYPGGDPTKWELQFSDGFERRSGRGDVVMGSPLEAVAWLVGSLDVIGSHLSEGSVVFTGGITAPFDVAQGRSYRAVCDDLKVEVNLEVEPRSR